MRLHKAEDTGQTALNPFPPMDPLCFKASPLSAAGGGGRRRGGGGGGGVRSSSHQRVEAFLPPLLVSLEPLLVFIQIHGTFHRAVALFRFSQSGLACWRPATVSQRN